ncbi:hypothetical protein JW988_00100 [Candidatus Bathyarchaeota archaeon]|nr:hypothetical protein [Candidatus Bathyarchaeota archaeon]
MRIIACLLLTLLLSSAFFGICIGKVWFEGYDPQETQEIRLHVEHKIPPVGRYKARPVCDLILSEAEPQIVNLTIIVTTYGMSGQNENFETWLSIDDQEPEKLFGTLHVTTAAFPAGPFFERQYYATLSELGDDVHLIKIRVAGEYDGGGSYDCEGNASFIFDTIPPKVSILSLENKTYSADNVPLDFITNEGISQSTYSLDGQENVTINANTTLTGLSEGDHTVTVYATDKAGNTGASETIYFRIDFFPTTLVIASVVTAAIIGVGLLVYFKKRKH